MHKLLLWISVILVLVTADQDQDKVEWCIDSNHHKKEPSPEDSLHSQCEPWKQYSCCNEGTTVRSHEPENQYRFNYNHCSGHPMSDKCKRHFVQDLCFYECEPHVKPWVVAVKRSFARERIYQVPLCAQDCQLWWNDCKDDYSCVANWARDFKWNKTNNCPTNSPCLPMHQIFTGAQQFCEMVWDHSWKYTEDKPCMRIWFDEKENPNKETALYYANQKSGQQTPLPSIVALAQIFVTFLFRF